MSRGLLIAARVITFLAVFDFIFTLVVSIKGSITLNGVEVEMTGTTLGLMWGSTIFWTAVAAYLYYRVHLASKAAAAETTTVTTIIPGEQKPLIVAQPVNSQHIVYTA